MPFGQQSVHACIIVQKDNHFILLAFEKKTRTCAELHKSGPETKKPKNHFSKQNLWFEIQKMLFFLKFFDFSEVFFVFLCFFLFLFLIYDIKNTKKTRKNMVFVTKRAKKP